MCIRDRLLAETKKKAKARAMEFDIEKILPIYEKMYDETVEKFHAISWFFHAMSQCFRNERYEIITENKKTNNQIMTENEIAYEIISACLEIHREVGPGLLESAYENALIYELKNRGLDVKQQVAMPFKYKGGCLLYTSRCV